MPHPKHCLYAFGLNGQQHKPLTWDQVRSWEPEQGQMWAHLDRTSGEVQKWLRDGSGLDPIVVEGLLASSTRPRIERINSGIILTLRGVNLNPGADPSDMISVRIWVDQHRIITLQRERLLSTASIAEQYELGNGPDSIGSILVAITVGLTQRMAPVIDDLNDSLDELEESVVSPTKTVDRMELITLRQRAIMLHRHIKPQVGALSDLHQTDLDLLDNVQRLALKETINRVFRFVEDLETAKGRAAVIQDEFSNELAQNMNQRMYFVTVIAAIFLPLTFVAGLLGANVGGIPGATNQHGFLITSGVLGVIGAAGYALARRSKWL